MVASRRSGPTISATTSRRRRNSRSTVRRALPLPAEGWIREIYDGVTMVPMPLVRPPRLARGSRVALVAPSGPLLERDDIARAAELCRALDYEPAIGRNAGSRYGY